MGRAEMRRARKEEKKYKTVTYTLTQEQLDKMVRDKIGDELERVKKEATDNAVNTAMVLLLTLPLEVLMDHYWTKSYAKRIPKFTDLVLEYYERWQDGEMAGRRVGYGQIERRSLGVWRSKTCGRGS